MELTEALVCLALAASPPITILAMRARDTALAEKLLTYLRQHQATGDPTPIVEKRLELQMAEVANQKLKLDAEKEERALRAASIVARANGGAVPPGMRG
jgi:hypothetical protein